MKNIIYFLFFSLCIMVSSCNKDDAYDITETVITEEDPTEEIPEIIIRTIDGTGQSVPGAAITIYVSGTNEAQAVTDANGEVQLALPTIPENERAFLFGEKALYNENYIRIEPEDIQAGVVEIVLGRAGESVMGYGGNFSSIITSTSVLVNGTVTDQAGNPAEGEVSIFEQSAFSGDTSAYSNSIALDANGYYEMLVPDNKNLLLMIVQVDECTLPTVQSINANDFLIVPLFGGGLYAENIGPFIQDTTLPTNTNATQSTYQEVSMNVTGVAEDCDGNPLPNSLITLRGVPSGQELNSLYTDATGAFSASVDTEVCDNLGTISVNVTPPANTGLDSKDFYIDFSASDSQIDTDTLILGECTSFSGTLVLSELYGDYNDLYVFVDIVSFDPNTMLVVTEAENPPPFPIGGGEVDIVIEKDAQQDWYITTFEYAENGVPLYTSNDNWLVMLEDDGETLSCAIGAIPGQIGMTVNVLSGPDAGQTIQLVGSLSLGY